MMPANVLTHLFRGSLAFWKRTFCTVDLLLEYTCFVKDRAQFNRYEVEVRNSRLNKN
jgi:hypothetical protein